MVTVLTRRIALALAALLALATTASAQVTFTPGANPTTLRFPAGPDFATDVLGDPWDFSNPEDLSPDPTEFFGWTQYEAARVIGTASAFLSNGAFHGTVNHGDNQLSLLYRGGYDLVNPGRTGIRFPISTSRYRKIAIRTTQTGAVSGGSSVITWFMYPLAHPQDQARFGQADFGPPLPGTHTRLLDLAAVTPIAGIPWNAEALVRGLRFDPSSVADPITISIDWVRLTTADGASAANMMVNVACSGAWSVLALDATGETAMRSGNGSANSVAVNYGVLPPGNYSLGLRCNGTMIGATTPFRVNAPAVVRVTSPGTTTGQDYATETLANGAWDFAQDGDIARLGNVVDASFVNGASGREFRARNLADGGVFAGDPNIYLLAETNNTTPIASNRYRYLTYTLLPQGPYDLMPPGGSVTRILWGAATSSSLTTLTNTQDIKLWPGSTRYTIDLAQLSATPDPISGHGIETECVAAGCPTTAWNTSSVRFLRIDPHEATSPQYFQLGRVYLTAMPEVAVGQDFVIRYQNTDSIFEGGDSHRVRFFADSDTNASTPGALIGTINGLTPVVGASERTFTWSVPQAFAAGAYYIYAEITDVTTGEVTGAYSEVPVRVYVPGAATVQINVARPTVGGREFSPFTIRGCAAKPGGSGNSGVDDIQISATGGSDLPPSQRGVTLTLGEDPVHNPALGIKSVNIPCAGSDAPGAEPSAGDVPYAQSGFQVSNVSGLMPGHWTLRVVARDAATGEIVEQAIPFVVEWKAAPARNLRATVTGNNISLAWDPPNEGGPILAYRIQVASNSSFQSLLTSVLLPPSVTSGSGPLPNGVWYIRVVTLNTYSHEGEPSNVLSLLMPGGGVPVAPGAPTLTAAQVSSSPISLTWAAGSGGAPTSYTLYAGTTPGGADLGAFPMGGATSISAAAPVGMRIYVRVVASNAVGSATSNEVNFQLSAPSAPAAPTMNTPVVSGRTVTFSWTAAAGAASYSIEARLSPTGPIIATLSVTGTSTSIPGVPPGAYFVTVRAVNAAGASNASNQVTAVVR